MNTKTLFSIAASSAVFAAVAGTTTLESAVVGVVKHTAATGEIAIGVPWNGVTVDKLVSSGVSTGDTISMWDEANSRYDVWEWDGDSWVPAIDTDHSYTTSKSASETTVAPGRAVWYKRAASKAITLLGTPVTGACATTVAGGSSSAPKYNLLCDPFPEAVTLSNITGTAGDQIALIGGTKAAVYTYHGDAWCTRSFETTTDAYGDRVQTETFTPVVSATIPAGSAFWYMSRGGSPTLTWKQ